MSVFFCDQCGMRPLIGTRFHCTTCGDYDQCQACRTDSKHDATHTVEELAPQEIPKENPRDVEFRNSIAKSIADMFGEGRPVEGFVLIDVDLFAVFVACHTYASSEDDMGRVASTLHDLKHVGAHRGVCNNNEGDVREGHCKRCKMELCGFMAWAGLSMLIDFNTMDTILAFCLAHERVEPQMHVVWHEKVDHWETLSPEEQEGFKERGKALFDHLNSLTWPLVLDE